MNSFYVIAFDSTHYAIKTEKQLKVQFKIDMIPTPREISASCGLSVKFSEALVNEIVSSLKETSKKGLHLYKITKLETGTRIAESINWED